MRACVAYWTAEPRSVHFLVGPGGVLLRSEGRWYIRGASVLTSSLSRSGHRHEAVPEYTPIYPAARMPFTSSAKPSRYE